LASGASPPVVPRRSLTGHVSHVTERGKRRAATVSLYVILRWTWDFRSLRSGSQHFRDRQGEEPIVFGENLGHMTKPLLISRRLENPKKETREQTAVEMI
jgi:hypothetical protein